MTPSGYGGNSKSIFAIFLILSSLFSSQLCRANSNCEERWREGLRQRENLQTGGGRSDRSNGGNATVTPLILHQALRDHWLDFYKEKFLADMGMHEAPEPGSRRLPKSIRRQLEMIKARENEAIESVDDDECATTSSDSPTDDRSLDRGAMTMKTERIRDVVAQRMMIDQGGSQASTRRPQRWGLVDSKARPVKRVISSTINDQWNRFASDSKRSYFNLNTSIPRGSEITNATLFLYVRNPSRSGSPLEELHVHIYKYTNDQQVKAEPIVFKKFQHDFSDGLWLSIELTNQVHQWVRAPGKNYGVMIKADLNGRDYINRTADDSNRTNTIILAMDVKESPPNSPLQSSSSSQQREPIIMPEEEATCNGDDPDQKCCRYPLEIDFASFGWDWVIAPKRYNAYYCAGNCPMNYKQMSVHAHLMQQLEVMATTNGSPAPSRSLGPCCTPQDYQDIKVIYIAQDRSIKETFIPGAIVLRCGCA